MNGPRWPWLRDTIQDADLITNVWKFNTVRVNMFPKMENWNIAGNMDLDAIVATFTSRHVVTMIEDHDFTGSYPAAAGITNSDGSYSMSLAEISAYWVDLANKYKDNPYVWFNLMNEPGLGGLSVDASSARWKEVHDAIITAIRSTGAQNIIVLDGHNFGQEGGFKNQSNDSAILTNGPYFTGKYSNIVFSLHMYDTWMDGLKRLNAYLDTAAEKGLAVIVGEYGASNNATTSATAAMFNATVPRGVGRIVWSWGSEDGGSDFDLTKKETTTQGAGWEIDHTDGSKPTNLTWMGNVVWDDTHDGLTLPVTTDIPLLVNGNFEAGLDNWLNWSGALVGTDSHGGTKSFHVASGAAGGGGQFIILKPNTTYKFSAWGKVSGTPEGGNAAVGVQYRPTETSPDEDQIKHILEFTGTDWTQKEVTFTTGDGAASANVFIWKAATNVDLFVDDISLAEVPPIVSNGGFEGGMDGWMNWSNAAAAPEGHTGLQSFKVAAGGAGGGGQYVTVKPNTSYKLTMWGKVSGALVDGSADAGFQYRPTETSPDEDQIKYFLTFDSTSWTKKEVTFTTGASVAGANVFIWKSAASVDLLIDDVQLAEISPDEVVTDPEPQPYEFVVDAVHFKGANGGEVTELPAGGLLTADVSVTRQGANQPVTVAVVLYDPNGEVVSLSFASKTMKDGESDTFTGGFTLPANTAGYTAKVELWNNLQEKSPLAEAIVLPGAAPIDTVAPSAPTGLAASAIGSTTLTLSWNAASQADGVTGYIVKQGNVVLADNVTATTFDVSGLAYNTSYTFTVIAKDAAGNNSEPASITAKTTKGNGNSNGNGNGNGNGKNK
ncbi:fibronectin type III domain protein [Paenibacillus taihuensis]|uniref:Fibronectin type III domain protein n=1 Tax=Paenibacillus taihuensis TaxID=1156355 RepID=A0A3D9RYR6_9BACL|nr:cellulase family glycosylhydrolase [Paenibacillus taihuensis]REE85139.1 fibronectin type III domain protein [Paenibacillus taihuensis]